MRKSIMKLGLIIFVILISGIVTRLITLLLPQLLSLSPYFFIGILLLGMFVLFVTGLIVLSVGITVVIKMNYGD